jgi:hypothetical protein
LNATALATLRPGPRWRQLASRERSVRLRFDDQTGTAVEFGVVRCADGRLRDTYPVGAHDMEIYAVNDIAPQILTRALTELSRAVLDGDPRCRRVVFAALADHADIEKAAAAAGFCHIVDVEVPGVELSLLVAEPDWVRKVDADIDKVPGS